MSSLFGALRASSLRTALRSPVLVVPVSLHRPLSTLNFCRNQRPQLDRRWRSNRWKSTIAVTDTSPITIDLPGGKEVVSATETLPDTGFVADAVNSIPPLQYGDFQVLGLGGWSPSGIIQSSFEIIHVWSGLPWFHTFIAATLFWRLLIFPFAVVGMRNSARMRPVAPRLTEASKAINDARLMGDTVAMQKASMEASKIRREAGVSMLGLVAPLIQLPISIGLFFGVRRMCELPLMQLTQSGFEWLPDLTQPGPYYILPILVAASGNLMITMSARDMDTSRPAMGHFMNVIRIATVLGIYWMDQFASGLLLCLFVTSTSAVAQSALFRSSIVRSLLRIPQWTPPPSGSLPLPTMRESFRHFFIKPAVASSGAPTPSSGIAQAYVPPSLAGSPSSPFRNPVFKTQPMVQRSPDVVAQPAPASKASSALFEDAALAPAPKPPKAAVRASKAAAQKPKVPKKATKAKGN